MSERILVFENDTMGLSLVMVSAGLWASIGVAVEMVPEAARWSSDQLALSRMALAGPVLLLVAVVTGQRVGAALRALHWRSLFGFALSNALLQVCLFRSYDLLGPALAVLLGVSLRPVVACCWCAMTGRGSVDARAWVAIVLATGGMSLLMYGSFNVGVERAWAQGLFCCVVSSGAFVAMTFFTVPLNKDASCTVAIGAGLSLTAVVLLGAAVLRAAVGAGGLRPAVVTGENLLLVAYVGCVGTALAFSVFSLGMARCSSMVGGLTAAVLQPVIAALLSVWFLGDAPIGGGMTGVLGCAVLLFSVPVLYLRKEVLMRLLRAPWHRHKQRTVSN